MSRCVRRLQWGGGGHPETPASWPIKTRGRNARIVLRGNKFMLSHEESYLLASFLENLHALEQPAKSLKRQSADRRFADWYDRLAEADVPAGPLYQWVCDGQKLKAIDQHFKRRNGWAKQSVQCALRNWGAVV